MSDRAQRIARITRDVRREAYPAPRDPSEPLIVGNPRPRSPVLVMRADFVALAEELAETVALRAEVERLKARVEKLRELILGVESTDGRCPWCDSFGVELAACGHFPDCPAFSARGEVRR